MFHVHLLSLSVPDPASAKKRMIPPCIPRKTLKHYRGLPFLVVAKSFKKETPQPNSSPDDGLGTALIWELSEFASAWRAVTKKHGVPKIVSCVLELLDPSPKTASLMN